MTGLQISSCKKDLKRKTEASNCSNCVMSMQERITIFGLKTWRRREHRTEKN